MGRGSSKAGGGGGRQNDQQLADVIANNKGLKLVNGAIDFDNTDAAEDYFKDQGDWINNLDTMEDASVTHYTGSGYLTINGMLRGTYKPDNDYKESVKGYIADIDSAIKKSVLKNPVIVHRYGSSKLFGIGNPPTDAELKGLIGAEFMDKGFTSTAVGRRGVKLGNSIGMNIKIPAGKGRGGFIGKASTHPGESEFLLKRGAKFRITGISKNEYGESMLDVEML